MAKERVAAVLLLCSVLVAGSAAVELNTAPAATAYVVGSECHVVPGTYSNGSATGTFSNTIDQDGWSFLELSTGSAGTTLDMAFAVGCLEAYFTHSLMFDYWQDFALNTYPKGVPGAELQKFMTEQEAWLRGQIASEAQFGKPYWVGMQHVMQQFDGLVQGYTQFADEGEALSPLYLYMLEAMGDLEDLDNVFPSTTDDGDGDARDGRGTHVPNKLQDTDCSGFIKILPDGSDIVVGHSTWRDFYAMIRVYKIYHLSYAPVGTVSMSSSPGFLHSKDDFYATPSTIVIETTNSIFNKELYNAITPKCAFSWQRAAVATEWASNGQEWTSMFAFLNSGTYNNQWMVVTTTGFQPGNVPTSGLLWILEQIPGTTQSADVTNVLLNQSYWGSYNIPYFPSIFNASGYPAQVTKYGNDFSYDMCPRAQIFRRNQTSVTDESDVRMLMRYNNYEHDPLSNGDPVLGAVCARGDLASTDPTAFGCVDSKVTTATSTLNTVYAVSGPTHVQQPVFVFDPKFASTPHTGVVNVWDFEWTTFSPAAQQQPQQA